MRKPLEKDTACDRTNPISPEPFAPVAVSAGVTALVPIGITLAAVEVMAPYLPEGFLLRQFLIAASLVAGVLLVTGLARAVWLKLRFSRESLEPAAKDPGLETS